MKAIALLLTLALATTALAQSKFSPDLTLESSLQSRHLAPGTIAPERSVLVTLNTDASPEALTEAGFRVDMLVGDVTVVTLPTDSLQALAELDAVRSIEPDRIHEPMLKYARDVSGVDALHYGIDTSFGHQCFTGKGVVLGIVDTGFDPNHPNFRAADGSRRVARFWNFTGSSDVCDEYDASTLYSFTTDTYKSSHATHVAGIMGGNYLGEASYMHWDENGGEALLTTDDAFPYYGVATEGTFAMAGGILSDRNILSGITRIIDFAEEQGMPAVINLSFGSTTGPHDGSDALTRAIDALAERAIICIASANSGDDPISLEHLFTEESTSIKTVAAKDINYATVTKSIDIWTADERPVTVTLIARNMEGEEQELFTVDPTGKLTLLQPSDNELIASGSLGAVGNLNTLNNRYNIFIGATNFWLASGWFLTLQVEGESGQHVWMYTADSILTLSNQHNGKILDGYTAGNSDNSVNSMACGENTITVGSYSSSNSYPTLGSSLCSYDEVVGDITSYSSYGKTFSGRQLPHITAPGSAIVSSISTHTTYDASEMVASADYGGRTYHWGVKQGTSMSTPFVAGSVALMLQADPSLGVERVRNILMETATTDEFTAAAPQRFGAGKINTLAAVQSVVRKITTGIHNTSLDNRLLIIRSSNMLQLTSGGDACMSAKLYSIDGRTVSYASGSGTVNLTTPPTAGIYILTLTTESGTISRKLAL